jgi:hypothetical protein
VTVGQLKMVARHGNPFYREKRNRAARSSVSDTPDRCRRSSS